MMEIYYEMLYALEQKVRQGIGVLEGILGMPELVQFTGDVNLVRRDFEKYLGAKYFRE